MVRILFPKSISALMLEARLITLLKSYSLFGSGNTDIVGCSVKLFRDTVLVGKSMLLTRPVATTKFSSVGKKPDATVIFVFK